MTGISVSDHCGQGNKKEKGGKNKETACQNEGRRWEKIVFPRNYDHVFSCRREDPTASSVLDQGEFDMISPAGLGPWGYAEVERWLLRVMPPQLPALPARI